MSQLKPTHEFSDASTPLAPNSGRPRFGTLRLSAASLFLASVALASAQTVFSATERADPGQPINVTGSGFVPSSTLTLRRYNSNGTLGAPVTLPSVDQSAIGMISKLPTNVAFGMYRLDAATDGVAGSSFLVNAPRIQWADAPTAMPDGIVRLVGRNLRPTTVAPTVRLVDATSGASITAAVTAAGDNAVSFRVPANAVAGRTYRVLLNSGLAGTASETTAPETLGVVAKGADPFGLGTAWGSDFVPIAAKVYNLKTDARLPLRASGNGVKDDAPALQGAIDYAFRTGGGTIYIPTGSYRVDNGSMIILRKGVVLKGDGAGKTILQVGYRFTPTVAPPSYGWAFQFDNGPTNGIAELTIRNLNGNATPNGVFRGATPTQPTYRCFLKNVDIEANNGLTPNLNRVREGVVQGCRFTSTSLKSGAFDASGSRYLRFVGNTLDYRAGRLGLNLGYRNVIEGNTVLVNDTYRTANSAETGGIEVTLCQQVLVKDNAVRGYGTPSIKLGDGEMIMSQASNVPDFWDSGTVATASGLRLTVSGRSWPTAWNSPNHDDLDRSFIAIVKGKGAGQWRRVASHDASSLTVDRAWAVLPDTTSTYAVGSLVSLEQTWIGNDVRNGTVGLMHWNGAIDCLIADNRLTDTGPVVVRSAAQKAPTADGTLAQCIAWNIDVRDNTVTSTNNRVAASISVSSFITRPVAAMGGIGTLMLGTDIADNSITGSYFYYNFPIYRYDGYEILAINELIGTCDPMTNWGTVLWNSTVTGSWQGLRTLNTAMDAIDTAITSLASRS